jgi:hypothetical protein
MAVLKNRAKMSTSTTGTGTITLGSAEDGYQTFADAGVANADVVRYVIEDGNNWEIGTGTYTATGTTLSRTVSESSNSDAAINLSGSATVFIGATAEDIPALYADNDVSATAPTASGNNAVAIGDSATAAGARSTALTYSHAGGVDSFAAGIGSSSSGRGAQAGQAVAIGNNAYVQATEAIGLGYYATIGSSATRAVALGHSYANGTNSLAAIITNNTNTYGASGANSIAMGYLSKATSSNSIAIGKQNIAQSNINCAAIGGLNNIASGHYAIIAGGNLNTASSSRSAVLGGQQNNATAQYSVVAGGSSGTASGSHAAVLGGTSNTASGEASFAHGQYAVASQYGQEAHASGRFATSGDAQGSQFILRADTTDATATVLTTNNSAAAATNQIVAASDTCIMFSGTLVAMQNGAQDQGGWEIKGLLKNDGGTTTLVSSNIQTFDDGNGWVVALTADNTNNALAITCTGEAAHNIRWVANIQTSEVTYA